jgi:hypothetical protein
MLQDIIQWKIQKEILRGGLERGEYVYFKRTWLHP